MPLNHIYKILYSYDNDVLSNNGGSRGPNRPPPLAIFFFHHRGRSCRRTVYPYPIMKMSHFLRKKGCRTPPPPPPPVTFQGWRGISLFPLPANKFWIRRWSNLKVYWVKNACWLWLICICVYIAYFFTILIKICVIIFLIYFAIICCYLLSPASKKNL